MNYLILLSPNKKSLSFGEKLKCIYSESWWNQTHIHQVRDYEVHTLPPYNQA